MLSTSSNKANIPWVEKYRPNQFDDIVLSNINRTIFKNIIEKNYFPNLLFYGPPGTGKTTTIINLINEYQKKHNQSHR
jgi:replication-associated recombination protein RarA